MVATQGMQPIVSMAHAPGRPLSACVLLLPLKPFVDATQGMKLKMKDMASKLGLGGGANPFGALGQ